MIRTDHINIHSLYQNGLPCTIESIRIETLGGVTIPCKYSNTDFTVQFQEDMAGQCIRIIVDCADCGLCKPHIIEKCFCDTNGNCLNCSTCGSDGFCQSICPDKKCTPSNTCVDCIDPSDCKGGKICSNGKCVCPANTYENEFEQCVECLNSSHCPHCNNCFAYSCNVKDCLGKQLRPTDCACVDCIDSADCKLIDVNMCCNEAGGCECCNGFMWDPIQVKCVPKPDCGPGSGITTPPCHTCIDGVIIPLQCPPGKIRTDDPNNCCKTMCDCDNPNCPQGDCIHSLTGPCYCNNCDSPCNGDNSCPDPACLCNEVTRRCQNNPCDAYCDENTPCPYGCGCDLIKKRCRGCDTVTCATCANLVGCMCDISTNNLCIPKPCSGPCLSPLDCKGPNCGCNPNTLKCVDCDAPCDSNLDCEWGCYCDKGTKRCKKNPCWKPCENGDQCDEGCGCWDSKGCYPCGSFDCTTCVNVDGCGCTDPIVGCTKKPRDCEDEFKIVKHDDSCTLEAILNTKDCCDCPDLGYNVIAAVTGNSIQVAMKLKKGHTTSSQDLDLTGIINDFPALSGNVSYDIIATYDNGSQLYVTDDAIANWSNFSPNLINPTYNVLCQNGSHPLTKLDIIFKTDVDFTFESGCNYYIPAGTTVTVYGCNQTKTEVIPMVSRLGCKRPIVTWYRDGVVFHKVYMDPNGVYQYNDIVSQPDGLALCSRYHAEVDCGCKRSTDYSCYGDELRPTRLNICNPIDINVNPNQAVCNTEITIDEVDVCALMNGWTYDLYINGLFEGSFVALFGKLFGGGITIVKPFPITSVELRFPCDDCQTCTILKTFQVLSPCNCAPLPLNLTLTTVPDCSTGFTYTFDGGVGPYNVTIVRTIPPQDHEYDKFTYFGAVPYNGSFAGPLENGDWYIKVVDSYGCEQRVQFNINCCDLGNPSVNYDCNTQEIVVTFDPTKPLQYELGGSGTWILLPNNGRISAALANGIYPGYVGLRRLTNTSCFDYFDVDVNCSSCNLNILNASLAADCQTITINSSPVWDEYSINNTFSWTAGVAPTILMVAPLTPGQSVTVYVRQAANPTCYTSVVLSCTSCGTYDLGTPNLNFNCNTGDLEVQNLNNPTIPALPVGCTVEFVTTINGTTYAPFSLPTTSWAANILIASGIEFMQPNNTISVLIRLRCGATLCTLAELNTVVAVPDDLGNVSYNCANPNIGLQWTGGSVQVEAYISGVWTLVNLGQILPNGSYLIRSVTGGPNCAVQKIVNVPCLGGPGSGDPCIDFGAYFTISGDPCGSTVTVQLSPSAPNSANITLRLLENAYSGCVNNAIWFSGANQLIPPGGSVVFTGVPIANRTRVIHYDVVGFGGDGCVCDVSIGNCSNAPSCGVINLNAGMINCVISGANRKISINNTNTANVLVYVDSGSGMQYKDFVNASQLKVIFGEYPFNTTVTVRLVCLTDPTSFSADISKTLNC